MNSMRFSKMSFLMIFAFAVFMLLAGGCASFDSGERVRMPAVRLAPLANMPDYVQAAAPEVQEAYQFAAANHHIVEQLPCYCGCNALGHKNNLQCYLKPGPAGEFDNHAAYCTVCVDITRDAMRLTGEGKDVAAIRAFVVDKYSKYGPSTDDPPSGDPMPAMGPQPAGSTGELPAGAPTGETAGACGQVGEATACGS